MGERAFVRDKLVELNRELSKELWVLPVVNGKVRLHVSRLVIPLEREKGGERGLRHSEQEARFTCCALLEGKLRGTFYYSVETPTQEPYSFSGGGTRAASTDVSLYIDDSGKYLNVVNMEFKAGQSDDIPKDIEKLLRESDSRVVIGNFYHLLNACGVNTLPSLAEKFEKSFLAILDSGAFKVDWDNITILFTICVRVERNLFTSFALERWFEPRNQDIRQYVSEFFDFARFEWDAVTSKYDEWTRFNHPESRSSALDRPPPRSKAVQYSALPDLEECYQRYWSQLLKKAPDDDDIHQGVSPTTARNMGVRARELQFEYIFNDPGYGVKLIFPRYSRMKGDRGTLLFKMLEKLRENIKSELDCELEWRAPQESRQDGHLVMQLGYQNNAIRHEAQWDRMQDEMIDGMARLVEITLRSLQRNLHK